MAHPASSGMRLAPLGCCPPIAIQCNNVCMLLTQCTRPWYLTSHLSFRWMDRGDGCKWDHDPGSFSVVSSLWSFCAHSTPGRGRPQGVALLLLHLQGIRKRRHFLLPSQKGRMISNPTIQDGWALNNLYGSPPNPASRHLHLDAEPSVKYVPLRWVVAAQFMDLKRKDALCWVLADYETLFLGRKIWLLLLTS